ncbi:MAG: hypothetical protein WDN28_12565 [Chthoniobacter sp.]
MRKTDRAIEDCRQDGLGQLPHGRADFGLFGSDVITRFGEVGGIAEVELIVDRINQRLGNVDRTPFFQFRSQSFDGVRDLFVSLSDGIIGGGVRYQQKESGEFRQRTFWQEHSEQ